jgi:hypothetical protein
MEIACALGIAGRIERVTAAELKTAAPRPRFCALSNMKLYAVGVAMPMWQSALRKHLSCVVAAQAHMQPSAAWCTPPGALLFSGQSLTPAQHIGALLLAMF